MNFDVFNIQFWDAACQSTMGILPPTSQPMLAK
jgi:hypothetical protein